MKWALLICVLFVVAVPAKANIAYDSNGSCASANASSCTPTSTTIGNIGIAFAVRSGSTTAPTCPTTPAWTCPGGSAFTGSGGSSSSAISWRVGCFVWTATNQASGTWTNAGNVVVLSYSGAIADCATVFGGSASSSAASTTLTYPAITIGVGSYSSWVIGLGGSRTATNVTNPTNMTARETSGTTAMAVGSDTSFPVSSWGSHTITVNASTRNVGVVLELEAASNCSGTSFGNGVVCVQSAYSQGGASQTVAATIPGVSSSDVLTIFSNYCENSSCNAVVTDTQTVGDSGTSTCVKSGNSPLNVTSPSDERTYAWICTGLSSGSHTITLTATGTTINYMSIYLTEWSGMTGGFDSASVDATAGGTSTAPSVSTSGTTANATDLILGFNNLNSGVSAQGSGYSPVSLNGAVEGKTVTSTGSQTANWTLGSSSNWIASIAPIVVSLPVSCTTRIALTGAGQC